MSVLIKGMEMPESCDKCIYSAWLNFYQIYGCNAVRKNEPALFDGKQTKSTAVARSARADNCPLVPVPPHGRLIDADALLNLLRHCMFPSDMVTTTALSMATNWIKEAPTIIESEGE